jgi:restriction system protein
MEQDAVPRIKNLLWPTLLAVRDLGGSARVRDINERVVQLAELGESQRKQRHGTKADRTKPAYRLGWARTSLKGLGALENTAKGIWSVTEYGRMATESSLTATDRPSS